MKSHTTAAFRDQLAKLPARARKDAHKAWRLWQADSSVPGLQFKKLKLRGNCWSVRVNDDFRTVGVMRDDAIIWFWIGSHGDYERLLKGM